MQVRPHWLFVGFGLVLLAVGGTSIFSTPDAETLYSPHPPITTCTSAGCLFIYTLEVGNTGSTVQDQVRVSFRADTLDTAIMKPTVRNFGKVDRPVAVTTEDGIRRYALGAVPPGTRVEIGFVLRAPSRGDAPSWNRILAGVEAATGKVKEGDPASTSLARMLYTLFGWL